MSRIKQLAKEGWAAKVQLHRGKYTVTLTRDNRTVEVVRDDYYTAIRDAVTAVNNHKEEAQ